MGKKRPMASIATAPVFPFPAADHFSDYGFDPQLLCFTEQEAKRAAARRQRRHQPPPPPLEPARFKLQKPISKKHQPKQQRRRWWSSAASAALHFFKRPSSSATARAAGTPAASSSSSSSSYSDSTAAASATRPLYFADHGGDDEATVFPWCACWAPAMRSGHLAAAEFGDSSAAVSYVSLRDINLGGGAGGGAPATPIYLVT